MIVRMLLLALIASIIPFEAASSAEPLAEARSLAKEGNTRAAIETIEKAVPTAAGRTRAELLNAQGWLEYREGRNDQAARLLDAALEEAKAGDDPALVLKITNNVGLNYFVAGDLARAETAFTTANGLGSTLAPEYLALIARQKKAAAVAEHVTAGVEQRVQGKFADAIAEYDKALAVDPDNARILEFRGYAYFRSDDLERAEADLTKAFEIDPSRTNTIVNLVKLHCRKLKDGVVDEAGFRRSLAVLGDGPAKIREVLMKDGEMRRTCGNYLESLTG